MRLTPSLSRRVRWGHFLNCKINDALAFCLLILSISSRLPALQSRKYIYIYNLGCCSDEQSASSRRVMTVLGAGRLSRRSAHPFAFSFARGATRSFSPTTRGWDIGWLADCCLPLWLFLRGVCIARFSLAEALLSEYNLFCLLFKKRWRTINVSTTLNTEISL